MAEQKEKTLAEDILHFVAQPRLPTRSEQQFEIAELCAHEYEVEREECWHLFTWIYRLDDGSAILVTENIEKAIPDVEAVDLMEESRKLYRLDQRLQREQREERRPKTHTEAAEFAESRGIIKWSLAQKCFNLMADECVVQSPQEKWDEELAEKCADMTPVPVPVPYAKEVFAYIFDDDSVIIYTKGGWVGAADNMDEGKKRIEEYLERKQKQSD